MTAQLANQFQVKPREGVVVTDTYPDTPAAKAGLQAGDVIVEFAGSKISSPQELQLAVEKAELGVRHPLAVVRNGKRLTLKFVPEEQPNNFGVVENSSRNNRSNGSPSKLDQLGMEISPLEAGVAAQLGQKDASGVVITAVRSGSPAESAGLESGMVISEINRQPMKSVEDVKAALQWKTIENGVLMLVRTANGSRFVALKS